MKQPQGFFEHITDFEIKITMNGEGFFIRLPEDEIEKDCLRIAVLQAVANCYGGHHFPVITVAEKYGAPPVVGYKQ